MTSRRASRVRLYTLSVLPECREQLIGSALMDAVERRLRALRIGDMIIGVFPTNARAIEFYERRGAATFDSRVIQRIEPHDARMTELERTEACDASATGTPG